ncbi:FAD/NAD(P)-binding protein [uncultured Ferrovibrio sp.]|jgi:uncharacterized NAD(P)/FAD-binding protein YdhS|uniref:FAD/NAD(P)-binding protein n=1 Tax=uncultured Ferrovibrio sp. TaxID=1576913 RepID=UPI002622F415|nr:FAD/NAD(P)-binding protein [uncultured Ferrovibrio sp.]
MTEPSLRTITALRIAIVGGGLSGAAILLSLLRHGCAVPLSITVFEPRGVIGAGLAYGEAASWHLLNVPAKRASMTDDADHWWRWARTNGPRHGWQDCAAAGPDSYLPRRLFGHYVTDIVSAAIRTQPSHMRVDLSRAPVQALLPNRDGGYVLRTEDGRFHDADTVILAPGACSPSTRLAGLDAIEGDQLVDDPWDLDQLGRIRRNAHVLIIGSALTMADTVLSLRRLGHRGRIDVLSRHGIVPEARRDVAAEASCLTPDIAQEGLSRLLRRLRQEIRSGAQDWQAVFEGLRPETQAIWMNLPPDARRRFARHLRTIWDSHRFRMPPSTAEELEELQAEGILRFHTGRLISATASETGLRIEYRERYGSVHKTLHVQAVINCTGPRGSRADADTVLLASLRQEGLLQDDVSGLGWQATPLGNLIDAAGQVQPRLFALGPPLRGTLLECTAINEIRQQAELQAKAILQGAQSGKPLSAQQALRPEWV